LPPAFMLVSCLAHHLLSHWYLAQLVTCFHAGILFGLPPAFLLVSCSACHLLSCWYLAQLATCFHAGILLSLLGPEDGGHMFLWNGWLSTDYMWLYPRRQYSSYNTQISIHIRKHDNIVTCLCESLLRNLSCSGKIRG
jgi:hypothetical protein